MSKHLFGIVCTHHGTAANNRGETEGNITTLQKVLWNGAVHTTVSAEAIRWALRYFWQAQGSTTNRRWVDGLNRQTWSDPGFQEGPREYIDDDVLGFMLAEAAKEESNPAEGGKRPRVRGKTTSRRARLEFTRAISLTPWVGDLTFNAASIGATPSAAMKGDFPVPYGTELHATRYQYGFALTPEALEVPARALDAVRGIVQLGEVAGNHARFLFDFSPESIVFRWTDDFAPRMLYAFEEAGGGVVGTPKLVRAVEVGDIEASELVIGGQLAETDGGRSLRERGAKVLAGVREAEGEIVARLSAGLNPR